MSGGLTLAVSGLVREFSKSHFRLEVDGFEIPAGSVQALLGPSGSGKSTLLEVLGLLAKPDAGTVLADGVATSTTDRATKLQIAAVFQRPYLFKGTVAANVGYGLAVRGVSKSQRRAPIEHALEQVGLGGFADRSVSALSGGEAQRVSLARALVIEPKVLLLDEPLASLDALLKRRLTREFAEILRDTGATAVWVTHDQDEAMVVADRIAIMNEGRIVAEGPTDDVMALPRDEWTARFLGLSKPMVGTATPYQDGLIAIRVDGVTVISTGFAEPGVQLLFSIAPEDVLLFAGDVDLPVTTARNRIPATVTDLSPRGSTMTVTLDAGGVEFTSSVSRASVQELGLECGTSVLAVFKATSVRWRVAE